MVFCVLRHHNQIELYGKLHMDPVSTMQSIKSVKNAWMDDCDFEKEGKPYDLCGTSSWGFWLVLGCKWFLGMLGVYLDQKEGLNYAGKWFSVYDFSLEIFEIGYATSEFSRSCVLYGRLEYMSSNENQSI